MAVGESEPEVRSAGSSVYSEYVAEQVAREDARKDSLEKRALAVITSAGAISTILFGLAAFNINKKHFTLPHSAVYTLSFAVAAFLLSAFLAMATIFPFYYEEVEPKELTAAIKERWHDSRSKAEEMTSLTRVKVLTSARKQNSMKANLLYAAIAFQVIAVAFVAASVWTIL